jgi:hypothetical protein
MTGDSPFSRPYHVFSHESLTAETYSASIRNRSGNGEGMRERVAIE